MEHQAICEKHMKPQMVEFAKMLAMRKKNPAIMSECLIVRRTLANTLWLSLADESNKVSTKAKSVINKRFEEVVESVMKQGVPRANAERHAQEGRPEQGK
jgi:hypothetical protein